MISARECDRGFLLRPAGEHTGRGVVERRQRQRLRRISACAAHGHDDPGDYAYHGVVVARQNRAVVTEQRIGDAGGNKVLPCKGIVGLDGLFAQISAGHDECSHTVRCGCGEQQMLKRGVGEHDAKLGQVVRDGWREFEGVGGAVDVVAGCAATQQHNGTNTAGQQVALNAIDVT